jgi:carboxyl-terminal processing protease
LEEKGYTSYLEKFEVNEAMLSRVVVMGMNEKITPRPNDLAKNKRLFQVYLKAEIARNVWDNESFYPIINETNEVLQQAIKLFDRIPELNRNKM